MGSTALPFPPHGTISQAWCPRPLKLWPPTETTNIHSNLRPLCMAFPPPLNPPPNTSCCSKHLKVSDANSLWKSVSECLTRDLIKTCRLKQKSYMQTQSRWPVSLAHITSSTDIDRMLLLKKKTQQKIQTDKKKPPRWHLRSQHLLLNCFFLCQK